MMGWPAKEKTPLPDPAARIELSDETIRALALYCSVTRIASDMTETDPLAYVKAYEDYIRHGRQTENN